MFNSYYSTKDICQIFDIGREALRHYERQGILNPKVNPDNGYRQYDYWDICMIIEILRYRSYGLSIAETKKTLFDLDFEKIIESLEKHTEEYTKQLIQYELLLKKAKSDLFYMRRAKDELNKLLENETPDLFFIPFATTPSNEYYESMRTAFNNSRFFTTAMKINYSNDNMVLEGQITNKGYADFLGIDKGIVIKSSPAVLKMIDIEGRRKPVEEAVVDNFREEISKKYSRSFDTIYIALVTRFFDSDKMLHQYYLEFALLS
ncbi:MerR family transcriptional regulator [Butyrivibrio sp. YAB3001]|uniref:MerR family transcriptional regulator n=1 Tax=Butyrivibrio sp. YAB3001 TaxID=1520812 RepID=UPI0008F62FA1|nr:MerR family transcriptional regulator [Butyrivibrio sp. YAB3001]SFD06524.1 DNA-binding transcriptional regulator, MerR family [Butyrivibrio sp. YAB3001]